MTLVTVIGRGHSGTRAMSHTLSASGVFMGMPLNESGDLLPPEDMYAACRVLARYVSWKPANEDNIGTWDWTPLYNMEIPSEFEELIYRYLTVVLTSEVEHKGWKIPETTLVFPWIVRMFPEVKYIYWIRDPRDCIIGPHLTDDLRDFGVDYQLTENEHQRRAISWRYQYDLVKATPKPKHWIEVRFEDFVLHQDETLRRLEAFLGIELAKIPVNTEAVNRWKIDPADPGIDHYELFRPAMLEYGYELP